jgi:2-polyprenyl-3-methyl-5-hydroxy-6-metoxy-1,4-benzoquinol methylase
MFNKRSLEPELMDHLVLDTHALHDNLQEIALTNRWFGSQRTLTSALNDLLKTHTHYFKHKTILIADLGCGGGDLLKAMHRWALAKKISVQLIGIDSNQMMLEHAIANYPIEGSVQYKQMSFLSNDFNHLQSDVMTLNSVCHHFSDDDLVVLLKQLRANTKLAIIINDLRRHWLPYVFIKYLAKLLHFSHISKHDGPLSVLRGFRRKEFIAILQRAEIKSFSLQKAWAFRWKIIIKGTDSDHHHQN